MPSTIQGRPFEPVGRTDSDRRTRWSDLLARITPPPTSLAEARADPDGALVFDASEADYLTCPARIVRCDEAALARLLADLDVLLVDNPSRTFVRYQRLRPGVRVSCAYQCCTCEYTGDFWLNPRFAPFELESAVRDVLAARLAALPWPTDVLLRRAKAAEPTRAAWPRRLAESLRGRMEAAAGEERIALAAEALAEYELVLALDNDYRRDLVPALACAFEAGAYYTAFALADRLLTHSWRDIARARYDTFTGRCICVAHAVLGRIAVRAGDERGAQLQLAAAAKAPFTPEADEVRPDAILLAEMSGLA
jgi:hypothetical protein